MVVPSTRYTVTGIRLFVSATKGLTPDIFMCSPVTKDDGIVPNGNCLGLNRMEQTVCLIKICLVTTQLQICEREMQLTF